MKKLLILTVVILAAVALTANAADGKAAYEKAKCAQCHGADGKGDTKMGKKSGAKDYTDAKVQAEMKDDKAFKAIKEGLKEGDKTLMKPTEGVTDEEIKAMIQYMRTFKK
ncbi:MAG TPA: cytochrome c [Verrucomicrobiae bacterium]